MQQLYVCRYIAEIKEQLKRTQFRIETCCANKVWKNLIALVIGGRVYKNFVIISYNSSAVKIYNATSSLMRFEKNILWKNAQAYYNAGVAAVHKFKSRRIGSSGEFLKVSSRLSTELEPKWQAHAYATVAPGSVGTYVVRSLVGVSLRLREF
jgi:hypothetical protein